MTAKAKASVAAKSTAKLFMHGRSQAVRLPKEYRFEGEEVRVSKVGDKVILEPLEKPPFDVDARRAELDAMGAADFFPTGFLTIPRSNRTGIRFRSIRRRGCSAWTPTS